MKPWLCLCLATTGCWKLERTDLERDRIPFAPEAGSIEGWVVEDREVDLECPDGETARFYFIYPSNSTGSLPTAVLYHSGAFDFVAGASPAAPLIGNHLSEPSRLEGAWGVRMAYATLGMYPPPLPGETHTGAVPVTLADRGVAMVLPVNCWGDWWHNAAGTADNDFEGDFFFRSGGTAASWAFRAAAEPGFAEAIRLELPFEPDPAAVYAIGLGEGGRAVGELLHAGLVPRAIGVDSLIDDLGSLPGAQPATTEGLERIFPAGDYDAGALGTAPVLPPTVFVYSPVDAVVPDGSQQDLLDRLEGQPDHLVLQGTSARHVLANEDLGLAEQLVDFLLVQ